MGGVIRIVVLFCHRWSPINHPTNTSTATLQSANTTVNAAMENGCAVITNLDEHSPQGLVHMKNVIDINVCDHLPDADRAATIGLAARDIAHSRYGWDSLVAQLRHVVQA